MSKGTNAKIEFLTHTLGKEILCATIENSNINEHKHNASEISLYSSGSVMNYYADLTTGHTQEEYKEFLKLLDFEYDSGYGGQELFGTIWYKDGTWSCRGEYDGSEWWYHSQCPEILNRLNRVDKVREQTLVNILNDKGKQDNS